MDEKRNEIILFENQGVKLEVNLKDETVWLNLEQMSELFSRDKSVVSRHIKNALAEELNDEQVVAKFATTTKHGAIDGKTQTHMVDYYNLDMIISIGYRVKSPQGVAFRKWANKILKDYMLKGYAVNQKRLEYLEKTIKLIDIANRIDERLEGNDAKEILKVIGGYSKALDLLDDYDHRTLKKIEGNVDDRKIEYQECINIINKLRFNEESSLFADGNKRIAATLFIYFLNFYGILYKNGKKVIDNNTLTALTLLIAESNPKEKDVIVDLVMNFLNNE